MKNELPVNAINWFEIPVTNFDRARRFYSTILSSEIHEMKMGEYLMGFFPVKMDEGATGVGGAIVQNPDAVPSTQGTLVYLNGGDDLRGVLNRVEGAGGKILLPKTNISAEYGYMALFMDTEGNKVGLHSMN